MQAFIDESFERDGVFVLGGYIASAEAWARFAVEWDKLLKPFGTLRGDGRYHFKMSEMAENKERLARVPIFFRVIEDHVLGWVSAKIDVSELKRAMSRIVVQNAEIDWGGYANPYFIAFRALVDLFHLNRRNMTQAIPIDQKIDFYFDDRMEKKPILEMWDNYMKARPEATKDFYGAAPRFEDDMILLPLQAADFWVWWVRKWYLERTPEKIKSCAFGSFGLRGERRFLRVEITYNEDQLVESLTKSARLQLDPGRPIYDVNDFIFD